MSDFQSPPLSIRHFLYLTLGIAIALWFNLSGLRVQPTTVVAGVSLASRAVGSLVQGGTIAAFLWLTARWLGRRPVKLQDPGATYVFVLSLNHFLVLVGSVFASLLFVYLRGPGSGEILLPLMSAGAFLIALTYVYGAIQAREWAWRTIFVCAFLMSATSIFQITYLFWSGPNSWLLTHFAFTLLCSRALLQTAIVVAVIVSLWIDWRRKTNRHWLHYFGIGLLALSSIQTSLPMSIRIAKTPIIFPW